MDSLGLTVIQAIYLFAPLVGGAVVSGVVLRLNLCSRLTVPIDHGMAVRNRRLFGENKTWRGLLCSVVGCALAVTAQKYVIGEGADTIAVLDYHDANAFLLGATFGVGAIVGELPNSFAKRQCGIPPGRKGSGVLGALFYFCDQVDVLLVTWPLLLFWVRPRWPLVLMSVVLVFLAHQLLSLLGYAIGARESAV